MSATTLDNRYLNTATGEAGQKQLQVVLSWQHRKGTIAYCLAQVSSHPENGSAIAVLSEIEFSYGENNLWSWDGYSGSLVSLASCKSK